MLDAVVHDDKATEAQPNGSGFCQDSYRSMRESVADQQEKLKQSVYYNLE